MSTKSNTVVNLVLVFFISLLSFSIGTFVGKKYSDNQHQLAALEPNKATAMNREVASLPESSTHTIGATMTDEEIAKLAEEFVTDDESDLPHSADADDQDIAVEPSDVAQDLADGKNPMPAPSPKVVSKENRVPSSLPKNVAQLAMGKFTVQVAAYADEAEARKMATDLKNKGYSAFYIPATVKGKTWYRVSVGQFATQQEAQSYKGDLLKKANVSSAIVQKIVE